MIGTVLQNTEMKKKNRIRIYSVLALNRTESQLLFFAHGITDTVTISTKSQNQCGPWTAEINVSINTERT